ncbi:MAG: thioredoxin family protein [Candidatus Cloacimonetes bacterium]|nr:thioredoxin family protein [Candidatus Cloacimonadota bacterium]
MKKLMLFFSLFLIISLAAEITPADTSQIVKPQITFLEFGSTTCIPCKMMEKVMEEVRTIYGDSVAVIFNNVNEERELSKTWNIKLIPTQIFLDADGKEFFRHEGYYPTEEIAKLFAENGLPKPEVKEEIKE